MRRTKSAFAFLAKTLGLPKRAIVVARGRSRRITFVEVHELAEDDVRSRLVEAAKAR